ncbi:unnamed protein product [Caenorhabditis nigoni]
MKDETCTGKPVLQGSDKLRDLVKRDLYQSTREMSNALVTTHTTIGNGLLKLGKTEELGRRIPYRSDPF